MAVCPNYGANNSVSKFCTSCGSPLPAPEPAPQQPASQPAQSVPVESAQSQYWQQPAQTQSVPVEPQQAIPIVPSQPVYATPITQPVQGRGNRPKSNGFCNAGLALSIIGWATFGLTAPLGLIFSFIGLIASNKKNEPGRGKAIAGLIVSGVLIFGLAISLPTVWADVQDAIDNGQVNNPYELLNAIDDANDRQTNVNDKYVKKILKSNWVAMEDGSYLEFGKQQTFKYYKSYYDTSDNYYTGKYRMYSGSDALELMEFDLTDVIKGVLDNSRIMIEQAGARIIFDESKCTFINCANNSLLLINAVTDTSFSFVTEDDYDKIH